METLFDQGATADDRAPQSGHSRQRSADREPLASRMRPRTLAQFVGQEHLLGVRSPLRTAIEQGSAHSMILYGPPGTGKTTLARMVAQAADAAFEELSAVAAGRAEVRGVLERATHRRSVAGQATVFFLDEIHRFNKAQQDALLPAVEEGLVTLIGATTENPAFEVNGALLSRLRVYTLVELTPKEIAWVLGQALSTDAADPPLSAGGGDQAPAGGGGQTSAGGGGQAPAGGGGHAGLGQEAGAYQRVDVDEDAIAFLAARAGGDARSAINALQLAVDTARERGEGRVDLARMEEALGRRAILYDKGGDRHYDYISAWIKATRGSDPDASIYYLAAMLQGGEDPRYIVRRMVILASEDVGNADPQALCLATAAAAAVEHVGMPEARYALAQTAIYLALAPKSDAAGRALAAGQRYLADNGVGAIPPWLAADRRSADHRPGSPTREYDNPHRHPGHLSSQELFPEGVEAPRFYDPDEGEATLRDRLERISQQRGRISEQGQGVPTRGEQASKQREGRS